MRAMASVLQNLWCWVHILRVSVSLSAVIPSAGQFVCRNQPLDRLPCIHTAVYGGNPPNPLIEFTERSLLERMIDRADKGYAIFWLKLEASNNLPLFMYTVWDASCQPPSTECPCMPLSRADGIYPKIYPAPPSRRTTTAPCSCRVSRGLTAYTLPVSLQHCTIISEFLPADYYYYYCRSLCGT